MAAASYRNSLVRQWELLKLLPSRKPGITASQLCGSLNAAGHEVSKRTVERDLAQLSQVFPLECNDKSAPYGWYWMAGYTLEVPGMALSDALTLKLVEDQMRPLLPARMLQGLESRFAQAAAKIAALEADNPSARWLAKVASVQPDMRVVPPAIDGVVLETIQQALLFDKQISCRYYSAHADITADYVLNPLGLVQRGQITYLVATAEPHEDTRLYAMHRMISAFLNDAPVSAPAAFSLKAYVENGALDFGTAEPINLKVWITSDLYRLLSETLVAEDMSMAKDGEGYVLSATVKDTWQLRWWVLSYAGSMTVLEPQSLREELKERLRRAVAMYD